MGSRLLRAQHREWHLGEPTARPSPPPPPPVPAPRAGVPAVLAAAGDGVPAAVFAAAGRGIGAPRRPHGVLLPAAGPAVVAGGGGEPGGVEGAAPPEHDRLPP